MLPFHRSTFFFSSHPSAFFETLFFFFWVSHFFEALPLQMDQNIFFTLKTRLQNCIFLILSTTLAYQSLSMDSKFLACEPKSCGNGLNISYPFRLPDQESYCGYPNFDVTCPDNNPVLTISNDQYIIKDIFPGNHSLLVANAVTYNNSCPAPLNNVSLGLTPFNLVPGYLNFSFLYGCNSSPPSYTYPITCGGDTNATSFSFASFYVEDVELDSCLRLVNAPVHNSGVDFGLLNYTEILQRGFMLKWTASNCSTCASSGGRCGFENSEFVCFCREGQSGSSCVNGKAAFNIGKWLIVAGVAVGAVILVSTVYCCMRRLSSYTGVAAFLRFLSCKSKDDNDIEAFLRNHGSLAPKRYSYSEVKKMTRSFKDRLGEGGYGSVFKGKLPNGCLVAVKVLKKSKSNGVEFINEVASISRTSHVNIVTLLGFCFDGSKRILIYEFMPNGSLDKYIYKENGAIAGHQLDCEKLYQIALGIARGLEYLHRGCNTRILHFDIKPQNILLDQNFCPKISDFGLAKICPERESNISMKDARGTIGYIAPEVFCRNFGGVSHKSDVYSYGMLVLEIIGGRQSPRITVNNTSEIYFPDWIHKRLELGEELGLPGINSEEENTVIKKMVLVSLWCIQTSPSNRPPMNRVVEMLQASLESLPIPPRPYLFSPPRAPEISVASFPILSSELLAS